jgi:hypothetical protein
MPIAYEPPPISVENTSGRKARVVLCRLDLVVTRVPTYALDMDKPIVLISMEPLNGAALCRVPGCGQRASVLINRYFNAEAWDSHSSGPLCKQHFLKSRQKWTDCEVHGSDDWLA